MAPSQGIVNKKYAEIIEEMMDKIQDPNSKLKYSYAKGTK
jgi:hypothetical protein